MRRLLVVLLVLLVPLKSVGAVVVPIVGSPNHQHAAFDSHALNVVAAQAGHAGGHHHAVTHAGCEGMAGAVDAEGDVVHEHACPHLGMASAPPVMLTLPADRTAPFVETQPTRPLVSIVLDILVPPPTPKS